MEPLLSIFILILLLNVAPALVPPTWLILAQFTFKMNLDPKVTLIVAVLAATLGRLVLYSYSKFFYNLIPLDKKNKIDKYKLKIQKHKAKFLELIFIYSLTPLPSNILFIAGGLTKISLKLLIPGFIIGRLISYSLGLFFFKHSILKLESMGFNILPYFDLILVLVTFVLLFINWENVLDNNLGKKSTD